MKLLRMEATIGFPENLKFQGLINVKKVYFYIPPYSNQTYTENQSFYRSWSSIKLKQKIQKNQNTKNTKKNLLSGVLSDI